IQAIWIYREYFKNKFTAKTNEIIVLFSEDTHYSLYKACNLLGLDFHVLPVNNTNRSIDYISTEKILDRLISRGNKYIISIANMGTTMFGSIDDVDALSALYLRKKINFKLHVDAAFGGFIYPFSNPDSTLNFNNSNIHSISVDAHKMLQAPYGTGIFIIRKNYIDNVITKEASYVEGHDHTLCGSRSGANPIATWMILNVHGSEGIKARIATFIEKTDYICNALNKLNVRYFRNDSMNIITIRSEDISEDICNRYTLVPNSHTESPEWWKIVVMDHVNWNLIEKFISDLGTYRERYFEVSAA
ncbi:MAG: aspartate aminotransferase family protein, partial [Candidatus Marinimicrobia bacterium]|nr:aspartate aminotransferase family protein [Candidatus Neomarinimicrobiota bacterium]